MEKNILALILAAVLSTPACAQIDFDSPSRLNFTDILNEQELNLQAPKAEMARPDSKYSCEGYPLTMRLSGRTVTLPAAGVWTLESHLATTDDLFPARRSFPKTLRENISAHIANSCDLLRKVLPGADCGEVYKSREDKQWTPPENGKAGQGALGGVRPSKEEELWIFNMMWAGDSMPKAGTKFLASYKGKSVVVVGGYERGPSSKRFLGGFQREVLWALGAENDSSEITLSALLDQGLPPGPVSCAQ